MVLTPRPALWQQLQRLHLQGASQYPSVWPTKRRNTAHRTVSALGRQSTRRYWQDVDRGIHDDSHTAHIQTACEHSAQEQQRLYLRVLRSEQRNMQPWQMADGMRPRVRPTNLQGLSTCAPLDAREAKPWTRKHCAAPIRKHMVFLYGDELQQHKSLCSPTHVHAPRVRAHPNAMNRRT